MSSLLSINVLGTTATVGSGGVVVSTSASTSASSGGTTSPSSGQSSGSTAPTSSPAPTSSAVVPNNIAKADWNIQVGQTLMVNQRQSNGPSAWVPYKVVYVFADGNAAVVKEPDCVGYTGFLAVGSNLRRQGESYASDTP